MTGPGDRDAATPALAVRPVHSDRMMVLLLAAICVAGPVAFGQGITLPNVTASVVSLAPEQSGLASSLLGFIQQSLGAVCVQWMGVFPVDTPMPMLAFCALGSVLGLVVLELWLPKR